MSCGILVNILDDGTIKYREDGKVMKNPNAPKINLEDLV